MQIIELEISNPKEPSRPYWHEWIPDHEVESTKLQIIAAGLTVRENGPVSWQRQLAAMENPGL